jgi:hypothetical protein
MTGGQSDTQARSGPQRRRPALPGSGARRNGGGRAAGWPWLDRLYRTIDVSGDDAGAKRKGGDAPRSYSPIDLTYESGQPLHDWPSRRTDKGQMLSPTTSARSMIRRRAPLPAFERFSESGAPQLVVRRGFDAGGRQRSDQGERRVGHPSQMDDGPLGNAMPHV